MKRTPRKFRAKDHIVGGGLTVRAGQIVDERDLRGYADALVRAGELVEVYGEFSESQRAGPTWA